MNSAAGSFIFCGQWMRTVRRLPETGMGYTVVSITLKDGRKFQQAVIDSGKLSKIRGLTEIPFGESDISEIKATHAKWDWREEP